MLLAGISVGLPCGLLHLGAKKDAATTSEGVRTPSPSTGRQLVWRPGPNGITGADAIDVPTAIRYVQQENPAFIGIGNSMLFTRLGKSPEAMTKLTGKPFVFLLRGGSKSAIWYLLLKNVVAASGVKPKAVFLFVRDDELTASLVGSEDNDSPFLLSLRRESEPELDRLMGLSGGKQDGNYIKQFTNWCALDEWQKQASARLVNLALDAGSGGLQKKAMRTIFNDRFSLEHLRGDVNTDQADGGASLPSTLSDDFSGTTLDEILKVAEQHSLKLAVVRIKRRPNEQGIVADENPQMPAYAAKLKTVIERRGGVFLDETYDPAIHLSDYLDSDHIRAERQDWYRNYFWERMAPLLHEP